MAFLGFTVKFCFVYLAALRDNMELYALSSGMVFPKLVSSILFSLLVLFFGLCDSTSLFLVSDASIR